MRGKQTVWIALGLTAACLAGIILLRTVRPPAPPREVPASELVRRDGRVYWQDEPVPFTGIITETYREGARKSRSVVSNGLLHGLSEGWHTNGVLQVREHFREGVSHGLREKWFASGAKLSEATIDSGRIEGVFKRWHENGTLAEQVPMKNGQPHGVSIAYHPDGSLKAKATLENGKVVEKKFWKSGEPTETHASQLTTSDRAPAL